MADLSRIKVDTGEVRSTYQNLNSKCTDIIGLIDYIEKMEMPEFVGDDATGYFTSLRTACRTLKTRLQEFNDSYTTAGNKDADRVDTSESDLASLAKKQEEEYM